MKYSFIVLAFCASLGYAQTRTVGIEASMQFGGLPTGGNLCNYGMYLRAPKSGFGGTCTNFIKEVDFWPQVTGPTAQSAALMPTSAMNYNIKVNYGGVTYPGQEYQSTGQTDWYVLNVADPNYLTWVTNTYIKGILLPLLASKPSVVTPAAYLSMDGFLSENYKSVGTWRNGAGWTTNVTWGAAYPQGTAPWVAAWANFFTYIKNNVPNVRLVPHGASMPDWTVFQTIFKDCPAFLIEWYNESCLSTTGCKNHSQFYQQVQALYWFANKAPQVFPGDPPTRVVDYGINMDNGDVHTALAVYSMIRGANTFFSLLGPTPSTAVNPSIWLPIAKKLGDPAKASGIQILATQQYHVVADGYNLMSRTFPGGVAYFNFTTGARTVTLPAGVTNWSGTKLASTLTLQAGRGEVVLFPVQ